MKNHISVKMMKIMTVKTKVMNFFLTNLMKLKTMMTSPSPNSTLFVMSVTRIYTLAISVSLHLNRTRIMFIDLLMSLTMKLLINIIMKL